MSAGTVEAANVRPVVVIADDNTEIRQLIEWAARRAGASIGASVADGAAALHAIRDIRPDLAILDVSMPELTGLQVCQSVRNDPDLAATQVMLLSAAVQPAAVEAGIAAGADRYAQKPFSPRELAGQIRELFTSEAPAR